jgi:hypothetical protein
MVSQVTMACARNNCELVLQKIPRRRFARWWIVEPPEFSAGPAVPWNHSCISVMKIDGATWLFWRSSLCSSGGSVCAWRCEVQPVLTASVEGSSGVSAMVSKYFEYRTVPVEFKHSENILGQIIVANVYLKYCKSEFCKRKY